MIKPTMAKLEMTKLTMNKVNMANYVNKQEIYSSANIKFY